MSEEIAATALLRAGLLQGISVLIVGGGKPPSRWPLARSAREACAALGATVSDCAPDLADETALDLEISSVLEQNGKIDLLVLDGDGLFAQSSSAQADTRRALGGCLDAVWDVTRAVVNRAFMQAGGGRIVYLSPSVEQGEHVQGVRAGLENLARTLSTEWARHAVTVVAIATGPASSADEVGALVAYLASPAGAYFSGCVLDLAAN